MGRFLLRFVHVLALALFVVQASGMTKLFAEDACEASCPGDDDHGNCPPDCTVCACCAHAPSVVPQVGPAVAAPPIVVPGHAHPDGSPPDADPDGIEHVPRSSRI